MANPNTTQNTAYSTDARYETPGGARQKANDVLVEAKQYSDAKLNVVQTIEQTVMSEMAQISGQLQSANDKLSQVEAGIDEVKSGGIIPPNMVTFEPWTGGESVIIGNTPVDTTPPIVTASVASGSYTSAISVILSSNEGGNIYYTLNGADPTTSSTVYTSPILLSANTILKFFGRDAAGNSSVVQTRTYTITITPDAPDTTAPNNVTTLVATSVTQTSLTLSWVASTSPDVAGYEVYRGGTLLTTVTGTSYADSSLTADTSYTFVVKAKDTTGNIASGVSVSVTTLAVIESDTTPPSPVTSLTAGTTTDTTIPISWTLSSSNDVANYEVAHSTNGTTFTVASATVVPTATTYTITGLIASTAYTVRVVAIDTSGNRSTAVTVAGTTAAASVGGHVNDESLTYFTTNPANGTIIPNPDNYFSGTNFFTFSITIKAPKSSLLLSRFVSNGSDNTNNKIRILRNNTNNFWVYIYGKTQAGVADLKEVATPSAYTDETSFYHLTIQRSGLTGGVIDLCVNGSRVARQGYANTVSINPSTHDLVIGDLSKTVEIKNVAYYNRVLSEAEILQNYNALK